MVTKLKIAIIAGVSIVAIVGITVGIVYGTKSDDDDDDNSCSKFNAPKLELKVDDDRLLASWTEPDNLNDCSVTYKLKYTIDGGTEEVKELKETEFKFDDLELKPCTEVVVILTAVNGDGDESDQATETFTKGVDAGFDEVTDLRITPTSGKDVSVTWVGPTGFDKCNQMKYKVTVNDAVSIVDGLEHTTSVEYCATTTVYVVPVIHDVEGKSKSEDITLDAPQEFDLVDALKIERIGGNLKATWSQLDGFSACPLTYKVTLNGADERELSTPEVEYQISEVCVDYIIQVIPVIEGIEGTPARENEYISVDAGFGQVADLTITPTEGKVVSVTWVSPTGFDKCNQMTYKVTVGVEEKIVEGLQHTASLEYCTTTTISVVPVIDEIEGTSNSQDTQLPISAGYATVASLTFERVDDKLKATWDKPEGYGACDFIYKVVFNDEPEDDTTLTEIVYDLTDGLCVEYTIQVTPVVEDTEGEPATEKVTTGVDNGFGEVEDLKITPLGGKDVSVTWVGPTGFDKCNLKYKVTVDGKEDIVEGLDHTISVEYCTTTIVYVVPVIDDIEGNPKSDDITLDVPQEFVLVDALKIERIGENLKATWSQLDGFSACSLTYKVTLNGADERELSTAEVEYQISEVCVDYIIQVTPVIEGIEGTPARANEYINVDAGFDEVTDLRITPTSGKVVSVTWVGPTGFDKCNQMKYKVTVNDAVSIVDGLEHTASVEYCAPTTVYVVPVIDDVEGNPKSDDITLDVPQEFVLVDALKIERIGENLKATWSQLDGFSACSLTYKVTLNGADERELTTAEVEYQISEVCVDYIILVIPVIEGIEGTPARENEYINVDAGFDEVTDLRITPTSGKVVSVTWVGPTGYDKCNQMKYKVTVNDAVSIVDGLEHTTSVEYCATTTVYVVPVIDDVEGNPKSEDITLEVPQEFVLVDALKIERTGDNLKATWSQLDGFSACPLTYKVTLNGADERELTTAEVEYQISEVCVDYIILVIPVIEGIEGTPAEEKEYIGVSAGFDKVTDLTVSITDKIAEVTWVGPEGFDKCDQMTYKVTVGDGAPADVAGLSFTISLEYCDPTTITVAPVIENIEGEQATEPLALDLQSGFGRITDFTYDALADNQLSLKWSRPTGFDKCTTMQYQVTVDGTPKIVDDPEYTTSFAYCATHVIQIVPVIDEIYGLQDGGTAEVVPIAVGEVDKLNSVIEEGRLTATWEKPSGLELCILQYAVELKQADIIIVPETPNDSTEYEFDLTDQCPGEDLVFTVFAKYNAVSGYPSASETPCPEPQ